jgi:hypothetical protein
MTLCKLCGSEVPENSIHIFRGGEERRNLLEKELHLPVTLCKHPPPESYWTEDVKF